MIAAPQTLAPPAPFPLVLAQSMRAEDVAPGVRRATYRLMTSAGPLVVHVVTIDPREPSVRLRVVTASDRLVSQGETLSSMATRTGAIAGVNADYFDIGNTNQPLNIVVNDGTLVRTPSKRIALEILRDRSIRVTNVAFTGSVGYPGGRVPLTKVNEWPPEGGASFLTPRFGTLRAAPDVVLAQLERAGDSAAASARAGERLGGDAQTAPVLDTPPSGIFRVTSVAPATSVTQLSGPALGFGPAALRVAPAPQLGDLVDVESSLAPPLDGVESAVGGGPLLVSRGASVEDPNAPAPEERDVRFPVSGAAVAGDGTLALVAVDGRQPSLSIGLTRPEFAALMLGIGANDALAFDSGGSAEIVARTLGDVEASVQNSPSDGEERRVADGLFVYSDAPRGLDPRLVVHPNGFAAFGGARVALRGAIVDSGGHRLRAAQLDPLVTAADPGDHVVSVREAGPNGTLHADLAYRTIDRAARIALDPERLNPDPNAIAHVAVRAFDASGAPIVLGADDVRWTARGAMLAERGAEIALPAGASDFTLAAAVGRHAPETVAMRVRVGARRIDLPIFANARDRWHFTTAPPDQPGALAVESPALALSYDFRGGERAAYAITIAELPGEPREFGCEVRGDGSGVGLRAAFVNRFGEKRALTLAKSVDWTGWRAISLALPPDLNPPVSLVALYAVPSLGATVVHTAGTLGFRAPYVLAAGSQ